MMEKYRETRRTMQPNSNVPLPDDPGAAEEVARRAGTYCLLNFPARWKAGTPSWDADRRRWLIPVVLALPAGDAIELGQLTFDGETLRLSTPRQTMLERARGAAPGD
jgi:hypothetical protein